MSPTLKLIKDVSFKLGGSINFIVPGNQDQGNEINRRLSIESRVSR